MEARKLPPLPQTEQISPVLKPNKPKLIHSSRGNQSHFAAAPFRSRVFALLIDGFLMNLFTSLSMSLLQSLTPELADIEAPIDYLITTLFVNVVGLFFVTCAPMMFTGQSPGKKVLRLKVISTDGQDLTPSQVLKRELWGKLISNFSIYGWLMPIWDEENRALHDKVCSTRVISL